MKTFRVMVLMTVLLAGATTRTPTTDDPPASAKAVSEPDCFFHNGVWYCP